MMMKRLMLLLGCVSLVGCLDVTTPSDHPSDPATESFAPGLGVNISQMQKVAVGSFFVYYKDLVVGTGTQLSTTTTVLVDYAGFLTNGVRFDAGQNAAIPLAGSVV